ncbi:MAG: hypothetical protein KA762_09960 [Ferruginibacter sp.]|nr:hypothetical protein [Ferruginibacter sp.]
MIILGEVVVVAKMEIMEVVILIEFALQLLMVLCAYKIALDILYNPTKSKDIG